MLKRKIWLLVTAILLASSISSYLLIRFAVTNQIRKNQIEEARRRLGLISLNVGNEYENIKEIENNRLSEHRDELTDVTEIIFRIINNYYARFKKGELTEAEAKGQAADYVRQFRYGNGGYFFIHGLDGINVTHANEDFYHKDVSGVIDAGTGERIFPKVKAAASKPEGGFVSFKFPKLKSRELEPKLVYVKLFQPWGWIVGTGEYMPDLERINEDEIAALKRDLDRSIAQYRIGAKGYYFVFDSRGEIIIHPDAVKSREYMRDFVDKHILPDARLGKTAMNYDWHSPAEPHRNNKKDVFLTYFQPLDWYIGAAVYDYDIQRPARDLSKLLVPIYAGVFLLALFAAYWLSRGVTRNIASLAGATKQLLLSDFSLSEESGRNLERISASKDETGLLARSFKQMLDALHGYILRLKETTALKERIESELKLAHEIQMDMLPKPDKAETEELSVAGCLFPARNVGGDLYDFFFMDGRLFVLVGDVSDKGVPAALFMSKTKTAAQLLAKTELSPARLLKRLNDVLAAQNEHFMFVTVFCGIMDIATGKLVYASAGHNMPVLVSGAESRFIPKPDGVPLGVYPEAEFGEYVLTLEKGQGLYVYTDGVTEAMNRSCELFGDDTLLKLLSGVKAGGNAADINSLVLAAVRAHAGGCDASDDISMLALLRKGT
ncbi:MAG: SpoIIE family protein phosphatase [Elusimicrobiaceae bacterium]